MQASLLAVLLAGCAAADPVAILGRPSADIGFVVDADGDATCTGTGAALSAWLAEPGTTNPLTDASPQLDWYDNGVRITEALTETETASLRSRLGTHVAGRGDRALWLFAHLTATNDADEPAAVRLCVSLTGVPEDHTLRRGGVLTSPDGVHLATSLLPADSSSEGDRVTLAYDAELEPGADLEVLLGLPGRPVAYEPRDLPDVRNTDPDDLMLEIAEWWRVRSNPDTIRLGSEIVASAYHAAVSGLILSAGDSGLAPTDAAEVISALARSGHLEAAGDRIEQLIQAQTDDGTFAGVEAPGDQAALTSALVDCARYAHDPKRWCAILWHALDPATTALGETPRDNHARRDVATVADILGRTGRAEVLRAEAGEPPTAPTRFHAPDEPLDLLAEAAEAMLSGDSDTIIEAWESVEDHLAGQPLPGVMMQGDQENALYAARLVTLITLAVVRSEGGTVRIHPAVPATWGDAGEALALYEFPSGIGPISLSVRTGDDGRVTTELEDLPPASEGLSIDPLRGAAPTGLRFRGKQLPEEEFEAGPPWTLEPKVGKIIFLDEPE